MALCLSISGSTQNSNYSNTSVLDSDNDKSHLTQYIALNELKTITLGAGESVSYLFSFADSRYYTIETYGSSDTYLSMV